jgi:filamentous hemagglutinin family protein
MRSFRLRHLPFAVAALCAAMSPPLRAQVSSGALPTGWTVTGGNAAFSQSGNTLNIVQATPQAIVNFQSFNVGSAAVVDIRQPGTQSALLARTVGGSASQIDGQIKANGALWLINPAGIMVGSGARIDVGSFVASTLNVSDSDFLAGRLTFQSGAMAGEVRNAGTINAASGGSIYLVAPTVTNAGTLNAPGGEVLLAAGQNVQLMDTGTPGVSVQITGTPGEAKNLGRIVAEAGRIGLAAGLVSNSGEIHADSVVSEGGRVFLRASGDLRTTASSDISANGTTGGRVELIADGAAAIDGRVAATGSAGSGGYVDTSGHTALDVVNVPVVGRGGEWHIDPYDIEIVATGSNATTGTSAIVSTGTGAQVGADTITAQLDAGVNVSITTGTGSPATDPTHGDITVSAAIAKTGSVASTLSLNANNNIVINAPITSANSALTLNLNSNRQDDYPGVDHSVSLNANLDLHGGVLTVSEGSAGLGNGTLMIGGGTTSLNLPTSAINAGTVWVLPNATLALNRSGSALSGILTNEGTVTVGGGSTVVLDHGGTSGGTFDVAAGSTLAMTAGYNFNGSAAFTGTGTVEWTGSIGLGVPVMFTTTSPSLVLHTTNLSNLDGGVLITQGAGVTVDGQVTLTGLAWNNAGTVSVGPGSTAALLLASGGSFNNLAGGTVHIDGGLLDATFDAVHPNGGTIELANGGTLRSIGTDLYNSGTLTGSGIVALGGASGGTLFNNGTVAPGTNSAAGTLSVQGNYTQGSTGTLAIKLAGTMGTGQFDLLDIAGSAQLAGTVQLQPMSGLAPANGAFADFVVAHGSGSGGTFGQVSAPSTGTTTLSVGYPASGTSVARVTASVPAPAPAPASNPVQQATNVVITALTSVDDSAPITKSQDGDHTGGSSKDSGAKTNDHTEKMYCN